MLKVILDLYWAGSGKKATVIEEKLELGPFVKVQKSWEASLEGVREDGSKEIVLEGAVGHAGYCDICAYDYSDFKYSGKIASHEYHEYEVKHFEIVGC